MTKLRTLFLLLCLAIAASACNESFTAEEDAGGIVFDANFLDTGPDAAVEDNTGDACESDADCEGSSDTCVTDLEGGYCSSVCNTDADCGSGSTCVQVGGGTSLCLDSCNPGGEDECRPGYGCSQGMVNVCLEGCEEDSDCDDGTECQLGGGFSGAGQCFTPGSAIGDACTGTDECPSGASFCFDEADSGFPGGYCAAFGCDPNNNTGCDAGATCLPFRRGGICYAGCEDNDDCRDGYDCQTDLNFPDRQSCQPAFDPADLGQVCSAGRGSCNGFCLSEGQTGWPDSYCVATGCDPDGDSTDCPGDGVCIEAGDAGVCLDGCATDGDCRGGYDCRPSNAEDPESALACVPGCDADLVCGNDEFECNTGTGLCTEPFVDTSLGEPCTPDGDGCTGGRCIDEEDDGWPAGMCTFPGCRLRGEGREVDCPTDTACVEDNAGDPDLGVCAPSCTDGTTCRPGYGCLPLDPEVTDGPMACQPACETDSCGGGRSCNTETGRCE
ncbi:MAG: hypothetical protein AB8I08_04615 [Sandaracinaceae bacterium]